MIDARAIEPTKMKKMKLQILVLCVFLHITSFNGAFANSDENNQSEQNPLHDAVVKDNIVSVKKLISKGTDVNLKNNNGATPLHLACQRGFENIATYLIEKGAEIGATDKDGLLPIYGAAQFGHLEVFKMMLEECERNGIDCTNSTDKMGMSLLHFASMNNKPNGAEMLRILLEKNLNVNLVGKDRTTPLHFAATGYPEMVELLLKHNASDHVDDKDSVGNSPIMYAAYGTGENRLKVYRILTSNNADVNAQNDRGETPLFFVSRFGGDDEAVVEFLIEKFARVNEKNKKEEAPIHYAARVGYSRIGECLIRNKANKDERIAEGQKTPLHLAAINGHTNFVQMLINHGADVNAEDENNFKPRDIAVMRTQGNTEMLELLIGSGDINKINANGKGLLHENIEEGGDFETFKWLLTKGGDINVIDGDGHTLLHSAAQSGRLDIVQWLFNHSMVDSMINKKDDYGNSALHFAVKGNHSKLAEFLLDNGADVNAMNYEFEFPIHFAAREGHEHILTLLSQHDANENVRNRRGRTPLFYAVLNGNENVVKLLIEHEDENQEFSLNDADALGKSALHVAAETGSVDIGRILSSNGALVNITDENDQTPLHVASFGGNAEFVDWLINSKFGSADETTAQINSPDKNGNTPLHLACQPHSPTEKGYEKIVRALLLKNADINVKDGNFNTPLSLCIQNGHQKIASILLNHSKKPNVKDADGRELLLIAAEKGYDEIVELLIEKGAILDAEDENNYKALHLAAKEGHVNIVKTLITHQSKEKKIETFINAETNNGDTALMLAVQNGHPEVLEELLKNKAKAVTPEGKKKLIDVARDTGNEETEELLVKHEAKQEGQFRVFLIFLMMILALLIPLVCFIILFFHKLLRKESTDNGTGLTLTDLLERYIFPQNRTMLATRIGKGAFGIIHKGYAHKIRQHETETLVAIKVVKASPADTGSLSESQKVLQSLGSELRVLMQCGAHINLVNLLGIVTENIANHEIMIITEYCRYGNLKDVLEKHHKNVKNSNSDSNLIQMTKSRSPGFATGVSVTHSNLMSWSYQVALGMQFLAARHVVHGNLCARAILLADGNVAKISDFGLARAMFKTDTYISEKEGKLEYKWLSVESMTSRVMTSKSDVWSFGILLWEVFSYGDTPYQDIDIYQLKRHVQNGYMNEKPHYATDNIYELMQYCWRPNPDARPSFDSLEKWLYQLL